MREYAPFPHMRRLLIKAIRSHADFRFNQSPVEMLKNTVSMGTPVRVRGGEGQGMIAPAIVVRDFAFTSISDAV
jgi:hypothetical protein